MSTLIILTSICSSGQEYTNEVPDSLLKKEYDELQELFYEIDEETPKEALLYAKAYLIKGKAENDSVKIGRAFKFFAYVSDDTFSYRYADSIIHYTKNSNHKYYPARGYMIKGTCLYNWGDYERSLDQFLIAYAYAKQQQSTNQLMEIRYFMGAIKNSWGYYDEALTIFKENLADIQQQENYRTEYQEDYIIALHSLSTCYISNNKIDSAKIYIKKGIAESLALKDSTRYYKFVMGSGIADYFDKNYTIAIDSINKTIPYITNSRTNLAIAYVYKGKCLYELQKQDEAIVHFKKADSIYNIDQKEFPELREMYQTLVDYYKEKKDVEKQLFYIDKLLHTDSILVYNYKDVNKKVVQKYDTPYLLSQNEALIATLNKDKSQLSRNIVGITIAALALIGGSFMYHYNRRKTYKKRFESLLSAQEQGNEKAVAVTDKKKGKNDQSFRAFRRYRTSHYGKIRCF